MFFRETVYLDFKNTNNEEMGHSVYKDTTVTNDNFEIFELHRSQAADNSGILVKNLNSRFFHVAISQDGIPYVYDADNQKIICRLSDMTCRLDGVLYTDLHK
ncbi:hypothetical protein J8655_18370 [Dickeya oryzae]|uniref:hypothetical protein n=1 Tax=Dickeya oryzae TaxID=1240404 RepID=UPI001AEC834B|nr:hypothetical protein [Dickeya oryzae]MBP2847413.1 hypothetical protein [Dickeya oryzae]